jgi:ribulose-5-phosphate 4-epimerase/fuculose-1-phosphate aldolase
MFARIIGSSPRVMLQPHQQAAFIFARHLSANASQLEFEKRVLQKKNTKGQSKPSDQQNRIDLAAAYRLSAMFGWEELIYNHLTCRLESDAGEPERFLINPYGMGFDEVTASSLVTIDTEGSVTTTVYQSHACTHIEKLTHTFAGNVLDPGTGTGRVNCAGFLIHSSVHEARPDAKCVIHFHQEDVVAVSTRPEGLMPVGQAYYALGDITTHDYEGLALLEGEKVSLVRDLGSKSKVMILHNHGALTCGSSIAEAFIKMYFLVRACQQQIKAGPTAKVPPKNIQHMATEQATGFNAEGFGTLEFAYLKRKLERLHGSDYKQ